MLPGVPITHERYYFVMIALTSENILADIWLSWHNVHDIGNILQKIAC
jgi:hypothetical protein